jgi:hypothetical protein
MIATLKGRLDMPNVYGTETIVLTHCVACGKPLTDPESIDRGMGPECSGQGYPVDFMGTPEEQEIKHRVRKMTILAAAAAQIGDIAKVRILADQIAELGYKQVADKIHKRFDNVEKNVKITIRVKDGRYVVNTPFRRGDKDAFIAAWRQIPGRRYSDGANTVPVAQKRALWGLLTEFFPGVYGESDSGVFRVPTGK